MRHTCAARMAGSLVGAGCELQAEEWKNLWKKGLKNNLKKLLTKEWQGDKLIKSPRERRTESRQTGRREANLDN